jgi:hypothetical protein
VNHFSALQFEVAKLGELLLAVLCESKSAYQK